MNDIEKAIEIYKDNIWHMEQNPDAFESDLPRFKLVLQALEKQLQSQWIPVSERLPDALQDVLIWFDRYGGYVGIGYYSSKKEMWIVGGRVLCFNVTHWMSLPEPPKEAENNANT